MAILAEKWNKAFDLLTYLLQSRDHIGGGGGGGGEI